MAKNDQKKWAVTKNFWVFHVALVKKVVKWPKKVVKWPKMTKKMVTTFVDQEGKNL